MPMTDRIMTQTAPWPQALEDMVVAFRYKPRWRFWLSPDLDRGQGSKGTTLVVEITEPDAYHPEKMRTVNHFFIVPAAAYDYRSWRRWLFDRIADVDTHERCEAFQVVDTPEYGVKHESHHHEVVTRPYAPSHGFGQDPYLVRELGTETDQKTSFRNELKP